MSMDLDSVFKKVDRGLFLPDGYEKQKDVDLPIPIGRGQTTSAPSVIRHMLELLQLRKGDKVLEIGTGFGYQTALLCELVGDENVVSVERYYELYERARFNLERAGYHPILRVGDGSCGWDEFAPYDRIIASASYPEFPEQLKGQLTEEGIAVLPVGRLVQRLVVYEKEYDRITYDIPVIFVPMIGRCGYKDG